MGQEFELTDLSVFQSIVDNSDVPVGITDETQRFVYANNAANRFFRLDAIRGKTLAEILPAGYEIELHDKIMASGKPDHKKVVHYENGVKVVEFEASAHPYYSGTRTYIVYRINNIEQHIKNALKTTQSLYSKLVENIPDAVLLHKMGRITHVNPAALKLLKAGDASRLIGTEAISLVHPEDRKIAAERIHQAATTPGHTSFPLEEKLVALDGTVFYAEVTNAAVEIEEELSVLVMIRDITQEKAYKEQLRETNAKLEELNRNLERKVEQELVRHREQEQLLIQQSKLAAMGEMIGAIAHQWRQPLNALGLNIQDLLDAKTHGELDEEYLRNLVNRSMQQIQYMSTTIDDFRNFFKSSKEKKSFSFVQSIHEVLSILSAQLKHHEIQTRVTADTAAADTLTLGYENELKQVLINLINNAKDAIDETGRGHGRILIDVALENENTICATIRDDGAGIPAEIRSKIFNPYFTTKEQGKGTGIGLYMSKTIIEQNMGGHLTLLDEPGTTAFKITLPILQL